jgi:regulator of sigma E protease
MPFLNTLVIVIEALLALNLLIFVHELGHFWAARWRGLKVERFAIWFGKPIWKKKIGGVEYALGWIPAGGYVSLPQMASMEAIEGKTDQKAEQLPSAPPLDKIIVAFAGPLFSFLLAVVFAFVVWKVGKPVTKGSDVPVLGWVVPDGPAGKAGLKPGDRILEIDDHPITNYGPPSTNNMEDSLVWNIMTSRNETIKIKYARNGQEFTTNAVPFKKETRWYERSDVRHLLVDSPMRAVIDRVMTNSPAQLAGLRPGDEIVGLNGEQVLHIYAVKFASDQMTNSGIVPVTFTIRRGSNTFDKTVVAAKPASPTNYPPMFGISWRDTSERFMSYPDPWSQIEAAAGQIFATISAVISRHTEIGAQHLGGAVMIIRVYTNLFEDEDGWRMVLWFSVVLNVNLALLNMLPLPVLDGGHILLSLIEAVRRRAAHPKILSYIQNAFAVLLITFMVWIAFYDTGDWIRSRSVKPKEIIFAPPAK